MKDLSYDDLYDFIQEASNNTYAGGARYESNPERKGYNELVYKKGNFHYRDSFSGYFKSWGTEVVRFKDQPVWNTLYGGGMLRGNESLSRDTFKFLKTALKSEDPKLQLFRGPTHLRLGDWRYYYKQEGNLEQFHGEEYITYQKKRVFTHQIIGGIIINR